jgi:Arc/MetJ-type ribon-helix-helix transcriptional regulator
MKQRITLSLDEDVVAGIKALGGESVSATVNEALRHAIAMEAHRRAVLEWMDELKAEHGEPTAEDYARADAFLDELEGIVRTDDAAA